MAHPRTAALAALAISVAAAWLPARAAAPTTATRTVSVAYSQTGGLAPVLVGSSTLLAPGAWQRVGPQENRVRVTGRDSSGARIAIALDYQPTIGGTTLSRVLCGGSGMLAVAPGSLLRVTPVTGQCADGSLSLPGSGSITLAFVRPLPKPPSNVIPPERRWAVIIGITDYAGSTHSTLGGVGDANAVQASLLKAGWRADHLRVLTDGAASGQAITDAMSWLAAHSSPSTYSLFHYSGHACIASRGPCGSGHTYLWGADNTFIPETTVSALLGKVRGHAWLDFAACESGAFDNGLHSPLRLVTAASQPHETAYEEPDWHESVWTGLVFDRAFLQGSAGEPPTRATITQMVSYGRAKAPQLTAGQSAGAQHPYAAGGDPTQTLRSPHL